MNEAQQNSKRSQLWAKSVATGMSMPHPLKTKQMADDTILKVWLTTSFGMPSHPNPAHRYRGRGLQNFVVVLGTSRKINLRSLTSGSQRHREAQPIEVLRRPESTAPGTMDRP